MYVQKAAETDIMTGLPNAAGFRTFVNRIRATGTLTAYNAFYINLKSFGLIIETTRTFLPSLRSTSAASCSR